VSEYLLVGTLCSINQRVLPQQQHSLGAGAALLLLFLGLICTLFEAAASAAVLLNSAFILRRLFVLPEKATVAMSTATLAWYV
jgi:hypothetical protein